MFQLLKTEGKARRGVFTCAHGTVQTPVFMNVGTQGAIKGALSAADLKAIQEIISLAVRSSFPTPTICICAPATGSCTIWAACTVL
mgnify:CR=1 FL=1